jgi:hypothetical protein
VGSILGILPPGTEWKVSNMGKRDGWRLVLLVLELVLDLLKAVR